MKRDAGFTLLEVVVSMTILAAIAGFIALGFRLASASIETGEEGARKMARLRAGIEILVRSIRSADAELVPLDGKQKSYFIGESNRLRFLSASPPSVVPGTGYRLVCFREGEDPSGRGIAAADASPFRAAGAETWEGTESARVFLRGARDLVLSYSAGPKPDGEWEWVESWDLADRGRLPGAVRIGFVTTRDDGTSEKTSIVVPVLAGG